MNFKILILLLFFPFLAISNELDISKMTNEEIIKERKGAMSKIKAFSTAIYPLVFAGEFDEIKDLNNKLLNNAEQFKLLFPEGCAIKYIIRHQDKGGKDDLLKAIHFIEMIIERDYS